MRSVVFGTFLLFAGSATAEVPSCVGSEDAIGIDMKAFDAGMKAAGFDLQIDGKCNDRGCSFKIEGGDGFLTAERSCVTKMFATVRWPDQKKRAALLMVAAATAIGRREPSKLSTDLMLTSTVAEAGERISFGDPGVFAANFNVGPYIVDFSVESADIMTPERRRRADDQRRRDAAEENDRLKGRLLEKPRDGR